MAKSAKRAATSRRKTKSVAKKAAPAAKKGKSAARAAGRKIKTAPAKRTVARKKTTRAAVRRTVRPAEKKASSGRTSAPKIPASAELIVRQGFIIDATGKEQHAVPEVVVIGNRQGMRWLSEVFAYLADQAAAHRSHEPHAGVHLMRLAAPVNPRLSDAIEFRFIPVVDANRAATFKRHGVTMKSREHGSLFERYVGVAETDFTKVARRLERDARRGADRKP